MIYLWHHSWMCRDQWYHKWIPLCHHKEFTWWQSLESHRDTDMREAVTFQQPRVLWGTTSHCDPFVDIIMPVFTVPSQRSHTMAFTWVIVTLTCEWLFTYQRPRVLCGATSHCDPSSCGSFMPEFSRWDHKNHKMTFTRQSSWDFHTSNSGFPASLSAVWADVTLWPICDIIHNRVFMTTPQISLKMTFMRVILRFTKWLYWSIFYVLFFLILWNRDINFLISRNIFLATLKTTVFF